MYLNKAILYGNLTRDVEIKALTSGTKVANFSIATNRNWKDANGEKKESVEYHNIVSFGKQAEVISTYFKKGDGIYVEGRIETQSWNDADNVKKYKTVIVLEQFQFGTKKGTNTVSETENTNEEDTNLDDITNAKIEYPVDDVNTEDIPF